MRTSLLAVISSAALVLASCAGIERNDGAFQPGGPQPVSVRVQTAEEVLWSQPLAVTASVLALRRATPGTVLMGRVVEVFHREGDRVGAGVSLARIESRDVAARLAQARAQLAGARAIEENARLMKERVDRLFEHDAASRKNVEDAAAGYEAAAANRSAAEEGVRAAEVALSFSTVASPFAGVVVERRVEAGDTAAPGMGLFVIEDTSKMKIEAQVAESLLAGLSRGESLEVEPEGLEKVVRKATLAEILPSADPRSRTVTLRALADNSDGVLRSGSSARLVLPRTKRAAVVAPETSLVRQGPLTGIFLVDAGGIARLRWVTTGVSRDGRVEILTGLVPGERFVAEPPAGLDDGRRVEEL